MCGACLHTCACDVFHMSSTAINPAGMERYGFLFHVIEHRFFKPEAFQLVAGG